MQEANIRLVDIRHTLPNLKALLLTLSSPVAPAPRQPISGPSSTYISSSPPRETPRAHGPSPADSPRRAHRPSRVRSALLQLVREASGRCVQPMRPTRTARTKPFMRVRVRWLAIEGTGGGARCCQERARGRMTPTMTTTATMTMTMTMMGRRTRRRGRRPLGLPM
jgi:hypothetical protein